jgi:hypothetical protein
MPGRGEGHPWWVRVGVIGGLLFVAFFGARSCQESQVRISEEQAIVTAQDQVDFEPTEVQVRLLRQGINREPFWFVSLAVTSKRDPDVFTRLAVVEVDANTGSVESIKEDAQRDKEAKGAQDGEPEEPLEP